MDNLVKTTGEISQEKIMEFIYPQIPEFDSQPEDYVSNHTRVKDYMKSKEFLLKHLKSLHYVELHQLF